MRPDRRLGPVGTRRRWGCRGLARAAFCACTTAARSDAADGPRGSVPPHAGGQRAVPPARDGRTCLLHTDRDQHGLHSRNLVQSGPLSVRKRLLLSVRRRLQGDKGFRRNEAMVQALGRMPGHACSWPRRRALTIGPRSPRSVKTLRVKEGSRAVGEERLRNDGLPREAQGRQWVTSWLPRREANEELWSPTRCTIVRHDHRE